MAHAPDVGSRVHIKLTTHDGETEIEGVVLPPAVQDHMTIKLANGYNISHPLSSIEILSVEQPSETEISTTSVPSTIRIYQPYASFTQEEPLLQRSITPLVL